MPDVRDIPYYRKSLPKHTHVDERYALRVLEHFFPEHHSGLQLSDKPDLINDEKDIGIEVTQATSKNEQEAQSLYAELLQTEDTNRWAYMQERIQQIGAIYENGILFGPKGTDSYDLILRAHTNKLDKLNSGNYRIYGTNELFILSDIIAVDTMHKDALVAMQKQASSREVYFSSVYVAVPGDIYIFDLQANKYRTVIFNRDEQYRISELARKEAALITEMAKGK